MMAEAVTRSAGASAMPDREAVLSVLRATPTPLTAGQLLRRLGLTPDWKGRLRTLLHGMATEGAFREDAVIGKLRGEPDLPLLAEVVVTGRDRHGAPFGRLAPTDPFGRRVGASGKLPIVFLHGDTAGEPLLVAGSRVMARLRGAGKNRYDALIMRRMDRPRFIGVFCDGADGQETPQVRSENACVRSVPADGANGAVDGDLILVADNGDRVEAVFGRPDDSVAVMDALRAEYDLPRVFPDDVLEEAARLRPPELEDWAVDRHDFRDVPFVTIDGPDARDFDDAIWSVREGKGFRLCVAIADVAHYVRAGSALDREACRRGHSVYLPDAVVPMLPPRLSEDLCSLLPGEERYCVVFELLIDESGEVTRSSIQRGVMRSHARLTYEQVQAMRDGTAPLVSGFNREWLDTLYATHAVLLAARLRRGCVVVEEQEPLRVALDRTGRLTVSETPPLESRDLVASFMIAAGQVVARALRDDGRPALFRHHDAAGRNADAPRLPAIYSLLPGMHAGLALDVYAHVTSPIRRYADLVCHRALFPSSGDPSVSLRDLPAHLAVTEARSGEISRKAQERLLSLWLIYHPEKVFEGHVAGATRSGVLIALTDTRTTGLLMSGDPASRNPDADSSRGSEACSGAEASLQDMRPVHSLKKGMAVQVVVLGLQPDGWGCLFRLVASAA
ncbi:RNB domain-containing ribonuclease [Acetobacter conturbans]|uniref:RNB domain-containing ribonuclease n=1 Tax=Acetobacter conturbans TaxID=1737472 RepID=A0ABX0JZ51_9PROT|nr:RNB domain-containing ribonuclease [Acetobacter conturbans]NHN88129.1 RNB domain-containing ribonuclease [Acetobacter conturbans]